MLYLISWVTDFASSLLMFGVSRSLAESGAEPLTLGMLGTAYSVSSIVSNVFAGRLSDRIGRKRTAISGMALLIVGVFGVTRLPAGHWTFFAAYGCGGLGVGAVYPAVIAWIGQGRSGKQASRAFLRFCLAFNLGVISGNLSGGWLFLHWGPHTPLYASMLLATVALVLISLAQENNAPRDATTDEATETLDDVVLSGAFARVGWIANLGGTFSVGVLMYLFPKLAVSLGVPSDQHGAMIAFSRSVVITTFFAMHYRHFWRHRFSTAAGAQLMGIVGLLCLSVADSQAGLTLGLLSLSVLFGYNYFASLFYSTTGSAENRKGTASGIHEATMALGLAAGSLCGGMAGNVAGVRAPFVLAAVVIAVLFVLQLFAYRKLISPLRRVNIVVPIAENS